MSAFQIEKICTEGAAGAVAFQKAAGDWVENMHMFPWDLITNQELKFLLVQQGHSVRSPSRPCPHMCVSSSRTALSNSLYPREKLTKHDFIFF